MNSGKSTLSEYIETKLKNAPNRKYSVFVKLFISRPMPTVYKSGQL